MKILQLCNKPPYPSVDGGTMAMDSITQGLMECGCEVKVLSVCSDKHPVLKERMDEDYLEATRFESVYVDLKVHKLDAAISLLCGESYHVKRFESRSFESKLIEILKAEEFDIVHIESIFLAPYLPAIRRYGNAKVVLRAHNVEHEIWRRIASQTPNMAKRWYLKKLALALRMYELEHLNAFDAIVCITQTDADYFRNTLSPEGHKCKRPMMVIPFGIRMPEIAGETSVIPNSLYHIGSMDWMPNQESIEWLLTDIWPLIHSQEPQVSLYLAGRKMPERFLEKSGDGLYVEGEVADANAYIADKQINVVPLLSGSGIRVKIIESMAAGKVVVTTSVGAQGIDYENGKNILIANTPQEFADQIKRLADNPSLCREIGQNARRLAEEHYDRNRLGKQLVDFYHNISGEIEL